jgi:hypothetical protein
MKQAFKRAASKYPDDAGSRPEGLRSGCSIGLAHEAEPGRTPPLITPMIR